MRRVAIVALLAVVAIVAMTACTRGQLAQWSLWYEQDPVAAIEYANRPEIQAQVADAADEVPTRASAASVWTRIAWCESGGRWDHPPVTNRTGTYSGGLMVGHRWWPIYGGREFAAYPYLASQAQQIVVAERILADNGWGAWDCA